MKKTAQITAALGGNMAASIAGPGTGSPTAAPADGRRFDGRSRDTSGCRIKLERIATDPNQPRKTFDPGELAALADSLRTFGQLQPCVVRWSQEVERYVIMAGERRFRAAEFARLPDLRCVVWEEAGGSLDEASITEVQIVENALRADVPPVEQAAAFRRLMDGRGWTGKQLAERLSIDPGTISKALALLTLDPDTRDAVDRGDLAPGTAYEVTKVPDPDTRAEVAAAVRAGGLTRAATAELVRETRADAPRRGGRPAAANSVSRYTTPGGWAVTVTAPAGATGTAAKELAGLASRLAAASRGGKKYAS